MKWPQIIDLLTKETERFNKLAKQTAKQVTPGNVHQLRVTSRRLRTVLALTRESIDTLVSKKLQKGLKNLQASLGKARTLDVAAHDASTFHLDSKRLKDKREKSRATIQKKLKSADRKQIVDALNKTAKKMKKLPPSQSLNAWLKLEDSLKQALSHPPLRKSKCHELRIDVKKVRYVLEAAGTPPAIIKQLQDALGRKHDLESLRHLYGKSPQIARAEKEQWQKARGLIKPAINAALRALSKEMH